MRFHLFFVLLCCAIVPNQTLCSIAYPTLLRNYFLMSVISSVSPSTMTGVEDQRFLLMPVISPSTPSFSFHGSSAH
jgi:hypothetical protein